jgi:hypothetical protein
VAGRRAFRARPSTFQNAVAPETLRASIAATALKPIVVVRTWSGSPPSPWTIERSTASSEGRPVTPTRRPSRSRGRAMPGWARTAASGSWAIDITPTMSLPFSRASARSWMSRTAKSVRPAVSSLAASLEDDGCCTSSVTPSASS